MRDAVGGIVNISLIATFIAIVSGYLAFNINYTKAFRMKNKIITALEEYDGQFDSNCRTSVEKYAKDIGYGQNIDMSCETDEMNQCAGGHCCILGTNNKGYKIVKFDSNNNDGVDRAYYKVTTKIMIDIPIISRLIQNSNGFKVSGTTKIITLRN